MSAQSVVELNPACANAQVEYANTMATAAAGYQFWVILEWRDSGGSRLGQEQLGPFPAPTVAPGAAVVDTLHACATSAPPSAGAHAVIAVANIVSGPNGQ